MVKKNAEINGATTEERLCARSDNQAIGRITRLMMRKARKHKDSDTSISLCGVSFRKNQKGDFQPVPWSRFVITALNIILPGIQHDSLRLQNMNELKSKLQEALTQYERLLNQM